MVTLIELFVAVKQGGETLGAWNAAPNLMTWTIPNSYAETCAQEIS